MRLRRFLKILKNDSGAALMMAMFTVLMLTMIATELMYETNVELQVSSQAINQVRAHYAAKAGIEISLLRIHIFRQANAAAGKMLPPGLLEQIWQFPFVWPPPLPEEMSSVDKDEVKSAVKASLMTSQYFTTIESEGSRIDINDLASPSKIIADATRKQILQIFEAQIEADEEFGARYRGYDFNRLINNLTDWIDEDRVSLNGGDEAGIYGDRGGPTVPPDQPFKTMTELHLVEDMNDELFDLLNPRITLFGIKGINVNFASKDVLMALHPEINSERADLILKDRADASRGPFKDLNDFVQYLNSIGLQGNPFVNENNQPVVPLLFDAEYNFRVRSTGQAGKITREITAIVYDFDQVKTNLKTQLVAQNPTPAPQQTPNTAGGPIGSPATPPTPTATPKPAEKKAPPNKRPNIVYWNET